MLGNRRLLDSPHPAWIRVGLALQSTAQLLPAIRYQGLYYRHAESKCTIYGYPGFGQVFRQQRIFRLLSWKYGLSTASDQDSKRKRS